jgi:hypothetical protein
MRNRPHPRRSAVDRLGLAIDCLPVATRRAMLDGVRSSERVIAGAYVDGEGGVCPMLAAHRQGSRTDFLSFAKSWDRFTSAARGPREATRRQVAILIDLLEESLARDDGLELDVAIAEHRALRAERMRRARRVFDGDDPRYGIIARRLRRKRDTAEEAPDTRERVLTGASR